jgi:hypothetical protein
MRRITLHDHLNPTQEVKIDADAVSTVEPFGSGSLVTVGQATVGVHETVAEVEAVVWPTS